jgi:exocyst complex component 6
VINLQNTGTEAAYLRSLDKFVEEKEKDIEAICGDNYEVSSKPKVG